MTSRRAPVLTRLLREEEGSFLVEILVSAVILLTVALGVVAAFDTAGAQSGQQRAQAVASNLAASELERLRSLRFGDLGGQIGTQTKAVGGTVFTIATDVNQAGNPLPAGAGCDISTRSADARRVSATVTWPSQGDQRPVRLTSVVAAPANADSTRGVLVVQVVNRDGFGVSALSISLAGPSSSSAVTDENGCARFTDLTAATGYRITFSRPGWLDPLGRDAIDDTVDIVAGATQTKSYQYDETSSARATFYWTVEGTAAGTRVAAPQSAVGWTHPNLSTPRIQTVSPASSSVISPPLPASSTPYGVLAGACTATPPAAANVGAVLSPNGTVAVRVPTFAVQVQGRGITGGNGMVNAPNARVFLSNCNGTRQQYTANASGLYRGGGVASGAPVTVCADGTYNGNRYVGSATITPTYTATNALTLTIARTTASPGTC